MSFSVIALSGSPRAGSSSEAIIRAFEAAGGGSFRVTIFDSLARLPHFNPDEETAAHPEVHRFREALRGADAIVICTPEYAHGVPGTLKNAIDWTVGSMEFYGKTTALITASSDGYHGHESLLETLNVIGAAGVEDLNLLIRFVRTKVGRDGTITDAHTLEALDQLACDFARALAGKSAAAMA